MEMLSVPLFAQAKTSPATLCNGSNVSIDSRKRGNCTKGTRKPRTTSFWAMGVRATGVSHRRLH